MNDSDLIREAFEPYYRTTLLAEETDPNKLNDLEAIDMDSYRVEKKAAAKIQLADADVGIAPVPTSEGGRRPEPELDRLSNVVKTFNG